MYSFNIRYLVKIFYSFCEIDIFCSVFGNIWLLLNFLWVICWAVNNASMRPMNNCIPSPDQILYVTHFPALQLYSYVNILGLFSYPFVSFSIFRGIKLEPKRSDESPKGTQRLPKGYTKEPIGCSKNHKIM